MEFNDSQYDGKTTMSQDDKQALSIMEETVQLKDGHYEMALPWKHSPPHLSNNKVVAEHRLKLLKRRLSRDPALSKMYSEFLVNLLNKGYARKVHKEVFDHSNDMISWYLPHHPVFHPQKPGKVRVVFDCSARYKGTSLNDQLLQGPDLTNSLTGVLTRFRQEPVALMSDIEAMFHQVHVLPKDCDALKFLWWSDGDIDRFPEEYQMMVHLFGGASSPSCANFALQKTAIDNAADFDTTTVKTKPLVVAKMEEYTREKMVNLKSTRLIDELFVFIYKNSKMEALEGYNDDLVMSYSILLWIRDTAIRIQSERSEFQSTLVESIGNLNKREPIMTPNRPKDNPWEMDINGEKEDLTWLLG